MRINQFEFHFVLYFLQALGQKLVLFVAIVCCNDMTVIESQIDVCWFDSVCLLQAYDDIFFSFQLG